MAKNKLSFIVKKIDVGAILLILKLTISSIKKFYYICNNKKIGANNMELNLPSPSTAKERLEEQEEREQSLENEVCKGELTNALKYCMNLPQAKGLLTDTPPNKVSSVSVAMGKVIFGEVISILGERRIVTEDDLILLDESNTKEQYKECKSTEEEDYNLEEFQNLSYNYIPLEYKARTVALAEAHPKWSLASLHKKGCSRLKRKEDLKKWKQDVKKGRTRNDKVTRINTETFNRFLEARASCEQN